VAVSSNGKYVFMGFGEEEAPGAVQVWKLPLNREPIAEI